MPPTPNKTLLVLLALLWLGLGIAQADWAGLSRFGEIAEIAIEPGGMRMDLRLAETAVPVGVAVPDTVPASPPPWLADRLPLLLDGNGKLLAGHLRSLGKVAASANAEAHYEATLSYPLQTQASAVSIVPPAGAAPPVGMVALHRTVPVSDLAPLEKTTKLVLDWDDPWRSHFDNPAFVRRHAEPRSYLYVEPYEVRHELLLRLADLQAWLDLGLQDAHHVEADEREGLRQKIGAFLLHRNPLQIDGASAVPQLDRVEFVHFNRGGVAPVREEGRLDTDTALVGVVLTYLTDAPAQTIQLQWDLFGTDARPRGLSLIQGEESFDGYMTPKQPIFDWSQAEALVPQQRAEEPAPPLRLEAAPTESMAQRAVLLAGFSLALTLLLFAPRWLHRKRVGVWLGLLLVLAAGVAFRPWTLALAVGGAPNAPSLDAAQAKTLLQALLHNAYRAFQVRDEEKAYDRLAKSLDGGLLDTIYLQQRQALSQQAQGLGGEGKVDRIEVLESQPQAQEASPVFRVSARWMAHGTVSHWGHSHERHNLYQALLDVRPADDGVWKIVGMEFLDGQRLEAKEN